MTRVGLLGITDSLGAGKDKHFILSSLIFVLIIIFYFFVVGSSLQIRLYSFHNRVTYDDIFSTHITNLPGDLLILLSLSMLWLLLSVKIPRVKLATLIFFSVFLVLIPLKNISIAQVGALTTMPIILSLIFANKYTNKKLIKLDKGLSLTYTAAAAILLASLGIGCLLFLIISGITASAVEEYPYSLYQKIFSFISPTIMIGLIFCIPLKILIRELVGKLKIKRILKPVFIVGDTISRARLLWCLSCLVILSFSISYFPHLITTNPNNIRLGVDSPFYVG